MSMDPERAQAIFIAAIELADIEERAAFLDRECGDDSLRQRVNLLLAAHDDSACLPGPALQCTGLHRTAVEQVGTVIAGRYKLLQQIGEGGMGVVFMAEQQEPVHRKVALKIIKPGMDSKQVVARFEAERQALAMMEHVNIARVLDAGATDNGRPFFVMELVHGVPIIDYCDANKLTPRERLELFVPVCHAIQHAHQKGIIHRDIKPSNVLVTMYDDKPVPKVIDFGVAKAVEQRLTEKTLFTNFGALVGTFEYMSPEQAEMNAFGVDTRSDVYSLGVLLYELLTGTTPLERKRLREAAFGEIVRLIKEEEPPRPSIRLSTSETRAKVSAARKTDPAKLSSLVRGELDWIVMRCLEKDRTRRYETANGVAKDIQRYLQNEPVEACPPTFGYRLWKVYSKNQATIGVVATFALFLFVALALVTWKWRDESQARSDAVAAKLDAEQKARQIQEGSEKLNAANATMEVAGQHAKFGQFADAEVEHKRAVELRPDHSLVWMRHGDFYADLGLWNLAAANYAKSFEIRPPETVGQWLHHALLQHMQGNNADYQKSCQQMMARFATSPDVFARCLLVRACSLSSDSIPGFDRLLGPEDVTKTPSAFQWVTFYCLGCTHFRAGRHAEAIVALRKALAKTKYHARSMNYPVLAMALFQSGQKSAARQELVNASQELDRWTTIALGKQSPRVPWTFSYDWAEFQVYYHQAHLLIEGFPPTEDPRTYILRGRTHAALGYPKQAAPQFAKAAVLAPGNYLIRAETFRFHAGVKQWPQAQAELQGMKNIRPNDAHVYIEAFRCFADNDRWDLAATEHEAAVRLKPEDISIRLERFRYHNEHFQTNQAEAAYAEAIGDRANDIVFRIKCGDFLANLQKWSKVRDEYVRILDADILGDGEINRSTWLKLAALQLYLDDLAGYRRTCTQLMDRYEKDKDVRTKIALERCCLLHPAPGVAPDRLKAMFKGVQGDHPEMGLHCDAIVSLRQEKDNIDLAALWETWNRHKWATQRIALARVYYARGDHYQARQLMGKVNVKNRIVDPSTGSYTSWELNLEAQLWYRQAESIIPCQRWQAVDELVKQQKWTAAVAALDSLLTPKNKSARDWGTRASCFTELGDWENAVKDGKHWVTLAPGYSPGLVKHGWICLQLRDNGKRYLEHCRWALDHHASSKNRDILNNVAWLCALDPAAASEADRALKLVDRALVNAPKNNFLNTRGCLLYRAGRYDEALEQLGSLINQPDRGGHAVDWLFFAMTHYRLGHKKEAEKYLKQASTWIASRPPTGWVQRVELQHFLAAAEMLILGKGRS